MPPERETWGRKRRSSTVATPNLRTVRKRDGLCIRASAEELERWKRAAAAAGALSLSAFARDALDERSPEVMPIDEAPPSPLPLANDPRWARDLALNAAGGRRT